MIDITIKSGLVHTFSRKSLSQSTDWTTLWAENVVSVSGYAIDPDAATPLSMTSLPTGEWVAKMIESYPDECREATEKLAVHYGINLDKPKPKKEKKPVVEDETSTDD